MAINISKLVDAVNKYQKLSNANTNWDSIADKYINRLRPIYSYYNKIGSFKMAGHSDPGKYIMEALERMKKRELLNDILDLATNDVNNFIEARLVSEDKRLRGLGLSYSEAEALQDILQKYQADVGFSSASI